jgi:hypothetical protein
MEEKWQSEYAEAIPFTRSEVAFILSVPTRTLNNWIDRQRLWQTSKRGYYRLTDVFDLAGFAAMRTANVPEKECANYVRNFGFYRGFLHGDQFTDFSNREGKWGVGVYDPSAMVTLRINMRSVGERIFQRISELAAGDRDQNFESFRILYRKAVELDRLPVGSVPSFEAGGSR